MFSIRKEILLRILLIVSFSVYIQSISAQKEVDWSLPKFGADIGRGLSFADRLVLPLDNCGFGCYNLDELDASTLFVNVNGIFRLNERIQLSVKWHSRFDKFFVPEREGHHGNQLDAIEKLRVVSIGAQVYVAYEFIQKTHFRLAGLTGLAAGVREKYNEMESPRTLITPRNHINMMAGVKATHYMGSGTYITSNVEYHAGLGYADTNFLQYSIGFEIDIAKN